MWNCHPLLFYSCYISCSQPQENLQELHPFSPLLWRVSLVWGSKSQSSGCTSKWCPDIECHYVLPPGEKCLYIAQKTCHDVLVADLVPASTFVLQCCRSQCDSIKHDSGILQPQQHHICKSKEGLLSCNFLRTPKWQFKMDKWNKTSPIHFPLFG